MILERFEVKGLAHYSYLVGCEQSKEVVVVDPKRDIATYVEFCSSRKLTIKAVLETHIHADYASGAPELADAVRAELCLSAYDEGELYHAVTPHRALREGDTFNFGTVKLQVLHTPGHTPEHISFLIFDLVKKDSNPVAILSGDFLFVGSLGRPDLLGEDTKHDLAVKLFETVRNKLAHLPGEMVIYPAHGAGSMCGAGMSDQASSTLQAERLANPYLDPQLTKEDFVARILSHVPPMPAYYPLMKKLNAAGAPKLGAIPGQRAIPLPEFEKLVNNGAVVIDVRHYLKFGEGHIPGSFGIGTGNQFVTWASWVIPYSAPIVLVCPDVASSFDAATALVRVGLDSVIGYLEGGFDAWRDAGKPVKVLNQISPTDLHERLRAGENVSVLDVRNDSEWRSGHIGGAAHTMCGLLPENLPSVDRPGKTIVVVCGGGYRSTVAGSILQRAGYEQLLNVTGGMSAWKADGLPVIAGSA